MLLLLAFTWGQLTWGAALAAVVYGLGVLSAYDAIMQTRSPQGATAWVLALLFMPLLAVPAYWFFGRTKFEDYVETRRVFDAKVAAELGESLRREVAQFQVEPEADECDDRTAGEMMAFKALATVPFTCGNQGRLLVDGHETFESILAGFDQAEDYILAQFYIIHDDRIGTKFQEKLLAATRRGVRVYLLTDAVGSFGLPDRYMETLEEAGVWTGKFGDRSFLKRFRLNFRNHRKIVVVDGKRAWVGGLNVGDEYLGRDPDMGNWRDTHLEVRGPVVQGLQYSFAGDWYHDCKEFLDLEWRLTPAPEDKCALILASGPADETETCGLLFTHMIESAEQRVWIASPYFVPDGRVLGALQLAALRGVDVKVLMPRKTDSVLFKYVPYSYLPEAERAGVKIYLYEDGFMHQKVVLVDDDYATVGTANLDNRSFRLNFEVTCLFNDEEFCGQVEEMLERDLDKSTRLTREDLEDKPVWFELAAQGTRLLSPIL